MAVYKENVWFFIKLAHVSVFDCQLGYVQVFAFSEMKSTFAYQ